MPSSDYGQIPLLYRIAINWWEPLLALGGAAQCYFSPKDLVTMATPSVLYHQSMHPIFTQLSGGWLLLAFNDAITLRLTNDPRIWTSVLTAGIISDLMYTLSIYEDLGAATFWNPLAWTFDMWVVFITTVPVMFIKCAFVAQVGLGPAWKAAKSKNS